MYILFSEFTTELHVIYEYGDLDVKLSLGIFLYSDVYTSNNNHLRCVLSIIIIPLLYIKLFIIHVS